MVQAYNFLASWQLFPEKSEFEYQLVPKSGNYKIETVHAGHLLSFSHNWVSIENEAFYAQYQVNPNGELHDFENKDLADAVAAEINNASCLTVQFFKQEQLVLKVVHEILANGFLKVSHYGTKDDGNPFMNVEVYHKQLSVLPYA
jgi:hypothetical protein